MEVAVLGGGREVGRLAILVKSRGKSFLLDYGLMFNDKVSYPGHVKPGELVGVALTHAHLDHSGALPLIYGSANPPKLYTTPLTLELSMLLIADFLNITRDYVPFEMGEVERMASKTVPTSLNDEFEAGDFVVRVRNAGHIPGSTMFMIEADGKTILYTGDFNTIETRLVEGARAPGRHVDLLVIEATYAGVEHPPRRELEKQFVERVATVVENRGVVLIPAFSVGRAQEILCILEKYDLPYPTYLDGMAREVAGILLQYPNFINEYQLLRSAIERVKYVTSRRERKRVVEKPGVIVSPAGMLKGGPAAFYMNRIAFNPKNAVFLVSYQLPNTPGRLLLDKGVWISGGSVKMVEATVEWFDFSSHGGHSEIVQFVDEVKPEKVLLVHGEGDKVDILASDLLEKGYEVVVGRNGVAVEL